MALTIDQFVSVRNPVKLVPVLKPPKQLVIDEAPKIKLDWDAKYVRHDNKWRAWPSLLIEHDFIEIEMAVNALGDRRREIVSLVWFLHTYVVEAQPIYKVKNNAWTIVPSPIINFEVAPSIAPLPAPPSRWDTPSTDLDYYYHDDHYNN